MERPEVGAARRSCAAADDADQQPQDHPEGFHERSQANEQRSRVTRRTDPMDKSIYLFVVDKQRGVFAVSATLRTDVMQLALLNSSVCCVCCLGQPHQIVGWPSGLLPASGWHTDVHLPCPRPCT